MNLFSCACTRLGIRGVKLYSALCHTTISTYHKPVLPCTAFHGSKQGMGRRMYVRFEVNWSLKPVLSDHNSTCNFSALGGDRSRSSLRRLMFVLLTGKLAGCVFVTAS